MYSRKREGQYAVTLTVLTIVLYTQTESKKVPRAPASDFGLRASALPLCVEHHTQHSLSCLNAHTQVHTGSKPRARQGAHE